MGPLEKYYTDQALYCAAMRFEKAQHYAVRALIAHEIEMAETPRAIKVARIAHLRAEYARYSSPANVPG